jgi:hypothetical protein
MDPYLEAPTLWPDVHLRLISVIGELLSPRLRPAYFAQIEERVYVAQESNERERLIVPDVTVIEVDPFAESSGGGTAVATAPFQAMTMTEVEVHEARIEIQDAASRDVVTVIEVLTPANKDRTSKGLESYDQKRDDILHSKSSLVEIDLLRDGFRYPIGGRFPAGEYRVHVCKYFERPYGWVWPIRLPDRLPTIRIPLRKGEAEVDLDLQAALNLVYDRAGYDLILDYTKPPTVELPDRAQEWAGRILSKSQHQIHEI